MKTGVVIDERYTRHYTGHHHPERPARIEALLEVVRERHDGGLVRVEPRPATTEEVTLNHDTDLVRRVAATADREHYAFDADTPVGSESYATALLAAGGLVRLVDAIMAGDVDNGFALVRPPGHHAERERAMGFCLFNNVAIAARVLRQRHGLERIAIVDWDLHHGNGTQHSFYDDPAVLYLSTHQYPFYPGTGAAGEIGTGPGAGFTVNVPLSAGSGDPELLEAFVHVVRPILRQYQPQFVLVSAGFDCHRRDPLGQLTATEEGIGLMARIVLECAQESAQGRLAAVLEGGYDLHAIATCTDRVLDMLAGGGRTQALPDLERGSTTAQVRRALATYWSLD